MAIEASPFVLAFEGSLTISQSEPVQAALRDALNKHPAVEIDCSGAEEIDVTFLQILVSAGRTAVALKKNLRLSSPPAGLLADAISRCGFPVPASGTTSVADIFSCHSPARP
jgi:ABC-type transporter Mla MlaB component